MWIGWIRGKLCDITFDFAHVIDLWFLRPIFKITVSQVLLFDWCETKRKRSIKYWADCMVLPFDHTHDLGLVVSRWKFEIALSEEWGWGRWLTWNERDVSRSFMTMTVTYGWVDVAYSDWGDFRTGRAVDISSYFYFSHGICPATNKIATPIK